MKKTVSLLFAAALAALTSAIPAQAGTGWGWQRNDGNNRMVTNDVWTLKLNLKSGSTYRISYNAYTGSDGVLDVTDLEDDLAEQGYNYTIDGFADNGFYNNTVLTKLVMKDDVTYFGKEAFRNCSNLKVVKLSNSLSQWNTNGQQFNNCASLDTVYYTGVEPEEGVAKLPPSMTMIPYLFLGYCNSIRRVEAPSVTTLYHRALANMAGLESVQLSDRLEVLFTDGTNWKRSVFHNDNETYMNMVDFQPCTFDANFKMAVSSFAVDNGGTSQTLTSGGNGMFANTGITNHMDFSACSFDTVPSLSFYKTCIAGVTLPATVTTVGDQAFKSLGNTAGFQGNNIPRIRFLGDVPTFNGTQGNAALYPYNGNRGPKTTGTSYRYAVVVDAGAYPAWTNDVSTFVPVSEFETTSVGDVKSYFSASSSDFPTPDHPEETLGATFLGSAQGRWNWLVQYVDHSTVKATWMNGDTELGETDVPVGEAAAWSGATPEKASDAQFDYTFLGWNTDPAATTALSDLSISAATTFYAIYSAATRSYTITWNMDDGTLIDTTTVAYGETPTHANPSKEGSRFTGWSPAVAAVTGAATYTATFEEVVGESYTITWLNHDGTQLGQDTVAAGDTPAYTGSTPTKDPTVDTVYTFSGWTPAVAAASADATYTATFTAGVRNYVVRFVDDDGTEISSAEYAYGTAADGIDVPADPTKATTAEYSYAFAGWVPAVAAVSGDATYAASYAPTARTYTAIFSDGVLDAEIARHDYAYGAAVEAPTPPDHYADGWSFKAWDPAISTMPASDANYTAVYTNNQYVITWVNGNGATIDTTKVAHGTVPSHSNPSLSATAKSTYSFLGWSTDGETVVSPLPAATGPVVYKAVYSRTVLQPMSLVLDSASYDTTQNEITVNTEAVSTDGGAIEGTAWYDDGKSVAATVDGNAIATTLTGLVAEHGYEWVVTASETAYGTTETASIRGRTWARNTRSWFEADAAALASGTYVPAKGSDSGAQVRLHATVALPDVLPRAHAAGGTAVVGIEAVQPNAGVQPAWYAWNGAEWVRLQGAEPKAGADNNLYGVVDFARKNASGDRVPAVAWYADGAQLVTAAGDWEVELVGNATALNSLAVVGDFDVSAATGEYDVGGNGTLILIY